VSVTLPSVRGIYRENANIAKSTWFGVGGNAQILYKPEDIEDLSYFLKNKADNILVTVIGAGSNLLIRDGGIEGIVIKFGRNFADIKYEEGYILAGAGALNYNVATFCKENSLSGLEFLVGIPGSVGGSIAMNAGSYGSDIASSLHKVQAIDYNGNICIFEGTDIGFSYRNNPLSKNWIFTQAWLKVSHATKEIVNDKMQQISQAREASQPIRTKTSGSTFKNPDEKKAWELIDAVGCRGLQIGDAIISEKHCNFIINKGNATAQDIEQLGEIARKKVFDKFGINLEWEIKIIGDNI
jgi:UDP-N-acetylmuramate dehydrogenase